MDVPHFSGTKDSTEDEVWIQDVAFMCEYKGLDLESVYRSMFINLRAPAALGRKVTT